MELCRAHRAAAGRARADQPDGRATSPATPARSPSGIARARDEGAALVVFPELALTGYPPEDLLLKTHFLDAAGAALEELAARDARTSSRWSASPSAPTTSTTPPRCSPTARVAADLPQDVPAELRRLRRAALLPVGRRGGAHRAERRRRSGSRSARTSGSPGPPATTEALAGAQVIVNLSASPYHAGKALERERMLVQRARDNLAAVVFCNTVGGQDELVFDGHSVAIDQDGAMLARAPQFEEALTICTIDPARSRRRGCATPATARPCGASGARPASRRSSTLARLDGRGRRRRGRRHGGRAARARGGGLHGAATGLRDYVDKNGFERVVFGLSGGIDSALVALIAVDALGPERVTCVSMPSPYSSEGTRATPARSPRTSAATSSSSTSSRPMKGYDEMLARGVRRHASRTSPRRTSRRASAATS